MMRKISLLVLLLGLLIASGCGKKEAVPVATLTPEPAAASAWQLEARLTESGGGNQKRTLRSAQGENLLELAAGNEGLLRYSITADTGKGAIAAYDLQFLSTQGTGRIIFEALDGAGKVLAAKDMVFSGRLQTGQQDRIYRNNYQGGWLKESIGSRDLPPAAVQQARSYRLTLEVGQGQHAMLRSFSVAQDLSSALKVSFAAMQSFRQGENGEVKVEATNDSGRDLQDVTLVLEEPYAYGVLVSDAKKQSGPWPDREKRSFNWRIKAQRADAVNLDQPWALTLKADGATLGSQMISVRDERPGKIFYVMTEDLEPMDAAGYPKAWGNQDGWLQAEEYRGQLIDKAEALNRIAERYGAKWTHYIAWPAVRAAEWAAEKSAKNDWRQVVEDVKVSVTREAARGHEYALHLHSDYDPELPGNLLSYDPVSDGLWANHLKHGWSHSVAEEGTIGATNSRTGMLYRYQRILDRLTADSEQGQIITARVGSFDFGNGAQSEAASTRAYRAVGLWGSTDADGNQGGLTSGVYGSEIYLAGEDDINRRTSDLKNSGIVEFRPTPKANIFYDSQTASVMNAKADEGMDFFAPGGVVKAGVHGIIGFTHAMFVMGEGDWRSTTGGQFAVLDQHLAYLKRRYADDNLLIFGTGKDLVRAYLDYYAPQPGVLYGKRLKDGWLVSQYALEILGSDIPADASYRHKVKVKYPLYLREAAFRIRVLKNGEPIYSTCGLPTPQNEVEFILDDKTAIYTLEVWHQPTIAKALRFWQSIRHNF